MPAATADEGRRYRRIGFRRIDRRHFPQTTSCPAREVARPEGLLPNKGVKPPGVAKPWAALIARLSWPGRRRPTSTRDPSKKEKERIGPGKFFGLGRILVGRRRSNRSYVNPVTPRGKAWILRVQGRSLCCIGNSVAEPGRRSFRVPLYTFSRPPASDFLPSPIWVMGCSETRLWCRSPIGRCLSEPNQLTITWMLSAILSGRGVMILVRWLA